jgi:glycosyltransferase involved in cell wall biosynthesis
LQDKIIFLNQMPQAQDADFKNSIDLPAIYQGAKALLYPSVFEGFGLPVLEGMASGIPVITSNCSCMPEVGGDAVLYVNPLDAGAIANAMNELNKDEKLGAAWIEKGKKQATNFSDKLLADRMWQVIESVLKK